MKTKEEILKMNKEELEDYKWSDDLDLKEDQNINCSDCSNCSYCSDCLYCSDCSDCSYCSNLVNGLYCRNLKLKIKYWDKYYICNVEVTKEEFEKKKREK